MLREPGLHEDVRCGSVPRGFFADRAAMITVNLSSLDAVLPPLLRRAVFAGWQMSRQSVTTSL